MPKILQEIIATLIAGGYLILLVASFFLFSTFTFVALLVFPILLCLPVLASLVSLPPSWKKLFTTQRSLTKEEAYQILGLDQMASLEEVIDSSRRLSTINNPDRGGSSFLVQLVEEAKTLLLADLESRQENFERKEVG